MYVHVDNDNYWGETFRHAWNAMLTSVYSSKILNFADLAIDAYAGCDFKIGSKCMTVY